MQTVHITANSRLSSQIKQQAILNAEQKVVQTPKVMTLSQWWQEWQTAALLTGELAANELPKKVLNGFEAQWLWERLLQEELDYRQQAHHESQQKVEQEYVQQNDELSQDSALKPIALLNVHTTAKQLYQAWLLSAEWLPEEWHQQEFLSDEAELFKTVLQRYLTYLKNKNWQDEALLAQQRLSWLANVKNGAQRLPERFVLHGFDDLSPNTQQWQAIVEKLGCVVQQEEMETVQGSMAFYPAQDAFDEAEQATSWAINQLLTLLKSKPLAEIKVAIVAPNVAEYKTSLMQCLDEQLYLHGLGNLQTQSQERVAIQSKLYNLSLGEPLFAQPIIENAWQSLNLFLQPEKSVTYSSWSQWLISAYTLGDFALRQQADSQFRRLQWANVHWPKLLETETAKHLPKSLITAIQKWFLLHSQQSQKTLSLKTFIDQAWQLLETVGWPGNRTLNSDEFQQKTAFENSLTQFAKLTEIAGKQSYSKWLSLLKRFLSEQLHQSQSVGYQPIQVMGMLEAGGQTFDGLWIMGLTNEAWPRMPSPNPFIPMHLQRQHGLPRSDANRELNYAQSVSQRLASSAGQVIWSYPQQMGEAILLPSTILPKPEQGQSKAATVQLYQAQTYHTLAESLLALRNENDGLLWELDAQGAQIAEGEIAPGGTGILQAQSQCPLMAYVDYRLGAKYGLQQVEDSLQNTNQGTLIHQVLEHFWLETKTQVAMLRLSQEALVARVKTHIEQAFESLQDSMAKGILEVEQARVLELCLQWLEVEAQRNSFAVVETEQEHLIQLAGIQFKIIIDRVDQVDGQAVILDYKTGKASIKSLLNTPLEAPQLAVYLLAIQQDIAGIGYALLHSDDGVKISAVVEQEEVLISKSRTIQVFAKLAEKEGGDYYETTWNDFLDHLKQQVLELAQQIQQGQAQMTFTKPQDIEFAAGKLALRLPEVLQQRQDQQQIYDAYEEGAE
ncbi:MAG: PD-(D/E)XK nuclease family protein [Thiomicrorhabdus sp.]|nr:PD-(D/E)XK nuclease family protein [Thiomicrorhabdus sp.]